MKLVCLPSQSGEGKSECYALCKKHNSGDGGWQHKPNSKVRKVLCLPLPLDIYADVSAIALTLVVVNADFLFSREATRAVTVLFSDADVLTSIAVVLFATGRAGLVGGVSVFLTFPSSALYRDSLVRLDLVGLCSLLFVLVC